MVTKEADKVRGVRSLDNYMAGHNGFIAGGCFKDIFSNKPFKDLDIFFNKEADFNEANEYYSNNEEEWYFYYENDKAKSFVNRNSKVRIELIRSTFGTPEEILSKFDFSITKFAYYKEESEKQEELEGLKLATVITYKCMFHEDFFEHLMTKKLVLEKEIGYPISTFERVLRYTQYGYGLCRESKLNLLNAIRKYQSTNLDEDLSKSLYWSFD